jgi:predicted Zn-dependent protease
MLCLLVFTGSVNASRQRITLAPQPGVYTEADVEKEVIFGREVAAAILADRKLVADDDVNRYLNLVGQSVARHSNRPEIDFLFAVVESSEINAYAAPGGYIFITTAALDLIRNEAELAAVLAHEIAHVSERHIVKALDIRADDESMTAMVSKIMGSAAESANVIFYQAVEHALDLLFSKGLNREDEYNADLQAVVLTAFSGYDPYAYPRLLERLSQTRPQRRIEIGNTHPPLDERIKRLEAIIRDQGLATVGYSTNEKRYRRHLPKGGLNGNLQ